MSLRSKKTIGKLILVILLGALLGTLLGELIGMALPDGVVKQFFIKAWTLALGPGELNAVLFSITFGFKLKINVVGVLGIGIAIYILRWY